jgi:hypothetical protein
MINLIKLEPKPLHITNNQLFIKKIISPFCNFCIFIFLDIKIFGLQNAKSHFNLSYSSIYRNITIDLLKQAVLEIDTYDWSFR